MLTRAPAIGEPQELTSAAIGCPCASRGVEAIAVAGLSLTHGGLRASRRPARAICDAYKFPRHGRLAPGSGSWFAEE